MGHALALWTPTTQVRRNAVDWLPRGFRVLDGRAWTVLVVNEQHVEDFGDNSYVNRRFDGDVSVRGGGGANGVSNEDAKGL